MDKKKTTKVTRRCTVPQCTSKGTDDVSFHYFPKDQKLCEQWITKLRLKHPITKFKSICGLHFKQTDYFFPGVGTKKRYLKKGSVPSIIKPKKTPAVPLKKVVHNKKTKMDVEPASPSSSEEAPNIEPKEKVTTVLIEVSGDIVVDGQNNSAKQIETEEKGIQVTPSIINENRGITVCDMIKTDRDLIAFTGILNLKLLDKICEAATMVDKKCKKSMILTLKQRIVLVYVKLKTDLTFLCLSPLFGVSPNTCKNYFKLTIQILVKVMKPTISWLEDEFIMSRLPASLQIPNKCLHCKVMTYSHSKEDYTLKVLIGMASSGLVTFLSPVYDGHITDKELFIQSGVLDKLTPNESAVVVEKSLSIENECKERNIELIRPPSLNRKIPTEGQENSNADMVTARVCVDRTIHRINNYKMLKGKINLYLVPYMDSIMTIVAGIVNLSTPILNKELFIDD